MNRHPLQKSGPPPDPLKGSPGPATRLLTSRSRAAVHRLALTLSLLAAVAPNVAVAVTQGSSGIDRIRRDHASGVLGLDDAVLLQVRAIVRPHTLPEAYRTASIASIKCGTDVLVEAVRAADRLSDAGRAQLAAELVRPNTTQFFDSPDGYFRVHYNVNGISAVPADDSDADGTPDYVERIATYADSSWRLEVGQYGFLPPPSDNGVGGSDAYDIYCQNIGAYGYAQPEVAGPEAWNDWTSYVVVHNTFIGFPPNDDPEGNPIGAAKATVAHEFMHACQFAHDLGEPSWWMEQCATWAEDEVFDPVNDNYNYLPGFFSVPQLPLYTTNGYHEYAAFVWPRFLSERHGTDIVRSIWEACVNTSVYSAMEIVLQNRGASLDSGFGEFVAWNWVTASRDDGEHYEEGASYPLVAVARTHSSYPVTDQANPGPLQGLSAHYIRFSPPGGIAGRPLKISFDGQDDVRWTVRVVTRTAGDVIAEYTMPLDSLNRQGDFTLHDFGSYQHAVMAPAVLDRVGSGISYNYEACLGLLPIDPVSPPDGEAAIAPVQFSWDAAAGAVSYRLQVADNPAFVMPAYDTSMTADQFSAEDLTQGTTYYWRLTVTDACTESDWSPVRSVIPTCGVVMTGDVNTDSALSAADVISLVNYTFKLGPAPLPIPQAGDVNCDRVITTSDIINLVNHVFKAGPAPCDVCTVL